MDRTGGYPNHHLQIWRSGYCDAPLLPPRAWARVRHNSNTDEDDSEETVESVDGDRSGSRAVPAYETKALIRGRERAEGRVCTRARKRAYGDQEP